MLFVVYITTSTRSNLLKQISCPESKLYPFYDKYECYVDCFGLKACLFLNRNTRYSGHLSLHRYHNII